MNTKYHLEELKGSDYKIIDEEPDILGWIIRDSAGLKVGKVRDLLFDTESLLVRYIICELKDNELNLKEREVLLPMGRVILDQQNETVLLNRLHNLYFQNAPAYTYDALNAEYEKLHYMVFIRMKINYQLYMIATHFMRTIILKMIIIEVESYKDLENQKTKIEKDTNFVSFLVFVSLLQIHSMKMDA